MPPASAPGAARGMLARSALAVASLLVATIALDRAMGWMGLPDDLRDQLTHPANQVEQRRSIEFDYEFRINSQGLRNPEIPLQAPAGETRVLVVGDSFVEGHGVGEADTFVRRLEKRLREERYDVRLINAGAAGKGPRWYAEITREMVARYRPEGVLLCLYANDLTDMHGPQAKRRRSAVNRWLHSVWPHIDTQLRIAKRRTKRHRRTDTVAKLSERAREQGIAEGTIKAWRHSVSPALIEAADRRDFNYWMLAMALLYPRHLSDALDIDRPEAERLWERMREKLVAIHRELAAADIELALVYLPASAQLDQTVGHANPALRFETVLREQWLSRESELQRRLRVLASELRIPLKDLTPALRDAVGAGEDLFWPFDGHFNQAGNRIVAEQLADWVAAQGLAGPRAERSVVAREPALR